MPDTTTALTSVDPLLAVLVATVAGLLVLAVPAPRLLPAAVLLLPVWLTVGQLRSLGAVAVAAKTSAFLPLALIGIGALRLRRRADPPPGGVLAYPWLALLLLLAVGGVEDQAVALAIRAGWVILTVAAAAVALTVPAYDDFARTVLRPLLLGLTASVLLLASSVVVDPATAFANGTSRLFPYAANPNEIGVLLATAIPLTLWRAGQAGRGRAAWYAVAALSVTTLLLIASRSAILAAAIGVVPLLWQVTRNRFPVLVAAVAGIALLTLGATSLVERSGETVELGRLVELDDRRLEIQQLYLEREISQRPLVGLLFSTGEYAAGSQELGVRTHSAYLDLLYVGGLITLLPAVALIAVSLAAAVSVVRRAPELGWPPSLLAVLAWQLAGLYAHGLASPALYYPTYVSAFWHVCIAMLFLVGRARLAQQPRGLPLLAGAGR